MQKLCINLVTESAKNNESGSIHTSKNTIKVVCKFATVVAIAILVAITTNNALLAGPPDPPPDCYDTPFLGPVDATIYIGKCEFTYTYWWRLACGAYYDSYIESVKLLVGDEDYCKEILLKEYQTIMNAIMVDLVGKQNPWDPELKIPNCKEGMSPTQWRFFRPSCRTEKPVIYWDCCLNRLVEEYMRCESTGYCYKTYIFCWEEKGERRVLYSKETGGGEFGNVGCKPLIINKEERYECIPNCKE